MPAWHWCRARHSACRRSSGYPIHWIPSSCGSAWIGCGGIATSFNEGSMSLATADVVSLLRSHRELFEIPREVAYLNNGSYTPLPRSVRAAGEAGVASKSTPWLIDRDADLDRADAVRAA